MLALSASLGPVPGTERLRFTTEQKEILLNKVETVAYPQKIELIGMENDQREALLRDLFEPEGLWPFDKKESDWLWSKMLYNSGTELPMFWTLKTTI